MSQPHPLERTSLAVFWAAIVLLVVASMGMAGGLSHGTAASNAAVDVQSAGTVVPHPHARPIPFLPVHIHPIGVNVPATVNPTSYYSAEPAPMGIGDFGVGLGGQPYTYNTTEFLGNFSWQKLNLDDGGDTQFTNQLNVVLQFIQSGVTYAYWIQDVAIMDSATGDLSFENNIWNFTNSNYCLSNSALSGNGTVYAYSGCEGYYAVSPSTQPGATETMPSPGDFSLFVRSYLSTTGVPEVAFEYWDGVTSYEVTYDNVIWPWATGVSSDNGFYVDGNSTAGSGNFYDAELTLGGPGGGAATIAQATTDASTRLLYWNGHNLEAPRAVWNFGSDTAEAISNVQSFFSHDSGGTPLTTQLNGTTRNATPAMAYDQDLVGRLAVSASGFSSGTVSVAGTLWKFEGDQATITLVPGTYSVWVNSSSQDNALGSCVIGAGQTTSVSLPSTCSGSGLATSTPTGTPSSVDLGQSVTFSTTVIDAGSGGDTFNWASLSSSLGCTSSTTDSISCTPVTAGTYPVAVTVTDSDGDSSTSGTLEFTVYSDPVAATPTATPSSVDIGQSVTFTETASNAGSGGDTYNWGSPSSGLGCTSSTTDTLSCRPTTSGSYSVAVTITDSNGLSSTSGALGYTVDTDPTVGTPSASPSTVTVGTEVTFTASPSGGSGGYSYAWTGLPTPCTDTSTASPVCTPGTSGSYSITVTVTDSNGYAVTSSALDFIVTGGSLAVTLTDTPSSPIDFGQSVTFTAEASGGTTPYSYAWQHLPTGCSSVDASSLSCTPSGAGTFSVTVSVTDAADDQASGGPISFTVNPALEVGAVSSSSSGIDLGQSVTFSAPDASGGSGTYTYAWSGLPTGCAASTLSSVTCTPSGTGTFSPSVTVTDSLGSTSTGTTHVTVYSDPSVSGVSASKASADVGQSVTFSASGVTGGTGSFSYEWTGLPTGCSTENSSTVSCTPTENGQFSLAVTVTDSNGLEATSPALSFAVSTDLSVGGVLVSKTSADVGQAVTFSAEGVSGGTGKYSYAWTNLPTGCVSENATTLSCTPSGAGQFSPAVTVTDSNGFEKTSSTPSFTVYSVPSTALTASPGSVLQSGSVTFEATVSGGAGGDTYAWSGLPAGCTAPAGANLTCSPSTPGTYQVTVTVTDQNGEHSSSSTSLTVNAALFGVPALEAYGALAVVVLIGVILAVVLLARRRRRTNQERRPEGPEHGATQYGEESGHDLGGIEPAAQLQSRAVQPSPAVSMPARSYAPRTDTAAVAAPTMVGSASFAQPREEPTAAYWEGPPSGSATCQRCGTVMPPGARYCGRCAIPLDGGRPPTNRAGSWGNVCKLCGNSMPQGAVYCGLCGYPLSGKPTG